MGAAVIKMKPSESAQRLLAVFMAMSALRKPLACEAENIRLSTEAFWPSSRYYLLVARRFAGFNSESGDTHVAERGGRRVHGAPGLWPDSA